MAVKIHTSKDSVWTNASGDNVPVKFVPKTDKVKEGLAGNIHKAALAAEKQLMALYLLMNSAFADVAKLVKEEYALKKGKDKKEGKGSLTWFNFDRSIKIEADINDIVKWDNALMTEALTLLNDYINGSLSENNELIGGLVKDAFANSKNMIDSRKIFQLLKYEGKIKNSKFLKACELIRNAQTIDKTKLYMRVWEKVDDGNYRNINLNFSSL
jgi:hypothetical protein